MPHRMRLLAACCISMAAVAAFAPDTGSGSGSAAPKAPKEPAPAKDLVEAAQTPAAAEPSSGSAPAELPADVAEQLKLAADNLTAARSDLAKAIAEGDELAKEVAHLKGALATADALSAQLRTELAAAKAKGKAKDLAAEVAPRAERVQVTVLKGRVSHRDAPDGKASEGVTFTTLVTSQEEADHLSEVAARGVIALAPAE